MKNIDWNNIKTKYPKAWNLLIQFKFDGWMPFYDVYNKIELGIESYDEPDVEIRHLYDFFDENEIWIEISASSINKWSYDIFKLTEDNFICIYDGESYINRIDAERMAFEMAFSLLEKLLSRY